MRHFSGLYDPRPSGLVRYGNCPADGFYLSTRTRRHYPFRPLLLGVAALFLAVAGSQASIIRDADGAGFSLPDERFSDGADVFCLDSPFESGSGITSEDRAESAGFFPDGFPDMASADMPDTRNVLGEERTAPFILAPPPDPPADSGVWMVAFTPWLGSLLVWQLHPPPPAWKKERRRLRRHRH